MDHSISRRLDFDSIRGRILLMEIFIKGFEPSEIIPIQIEWNDLDILSLLEESIVDREIGK